MEKRPKKLFGRVCDAIRLKHYSIRTEAGLAFGSIPRVGCLGCGELTRSDNDDKNQQQQRTNYLQPNTSESRFDGVL